MTHAITYIDTICPMNAEGIAQLVGHIGIGDGVKITRPNSVRYNDLIYHDFFHAIHCKTIAASYGTLWAVTDVYQMVTIYRLPELRDALYDRDGYPLFTAQKIDDIQAERYHEIYMEKRIARFPTGEPKPINNITSVNHDTYAVEIIPPREQRIFVI